MGLNFNWRRKEAQYQTGEALFLNKIRLGGYSWNSSRPGGEDGDKWAGIVDLPTLAHDSKYTFGNSEEALKLRMENIVSAWFKEALKHGTSDSM